MTALVFRVQYDTSLIIAWFLSCQPHCPYLKYIFKRIKVLLSTFHFLIFDEVWPSDIEAFWFFRKKRRKKSERNLCVFFFFYIFDFMVNFLRWVVAVRAAVNLRLCLNKTKQKLVIVEKSHDFFRRIPTGTTAQTKKSFVFYFILFLSFSISFLNMFNYNIYRVPDQSGGMQVHIL